MVYVFNHNKNDACYNMEKHWKHPQWKKPYRKSHPDHTHLVHYPWRFLTCGKAPVMVPEKENCIRIEKDICTKLRQLVKVEVDLWIRWLEDSFIILISGICTGFLGEYPCLGSNTLEYFVWRGKYEYFESCYWTFSVSWKWLKNKLLLKTTMSIGQKSQDNIKHG